MSSGHFSTGPARRHLVAVAGLVLALAGVAACGADPASPDALRPQHTSSDQTPNPEVLSPQLADPAFVSVPAVGLSARLQPLHLNAHGILVPPQYGNAGWYEAGPEPGEPGPAVIAGHLDSQTGPDAFFNLGQVRTGERIHVRLEDGSTLAFRVTEIEQFPQDKFPTTRVYGATKKPELRLITCAGDYDHAAGHYLDNLVVFADLAI